MLQNICLKEKKYFSNFSNMTHLRAAGGLWVCSCENEDLVDVGVIGAVVGQGGRHYLLDASNNNT